MAKVDYFVWYYEESGDLARVIICAWNPDDARDIFLMNGGDVERIDKIEPVADSK